MKKKITSIALAGCLLFSQVSIAAANEEAYINQEVKPVLYKQNTQDIVPHSTTIIPKEIKSETEELKINAAIPVFTGLKDTDFQNTLNEQIMSQAMQAITEAKADSHSFAEDCRKNGWPVRPNEIYINYDIKTNLDNIISLQVVSYYNNGGTGKPIIDFYNIVNDEKARTIELKDLLGENYKELINPQINKQIQANPDIYFKGEEGFKTIAANQGFYLENLDVVIVFDKYEIAPGYVGNPEFRIALPYQKDKLLINSKEINLNKEIYTNENGTTMLPLRTLAEELGYQVAWNNELSAVELTKGSQFIMLKTGEDYYTTDKMAPVKLGTAAEIINGTTYIPANFISDILKLNITRSIDGIIQVSTGENSEYYGVLNSTYEIEGDRITLKNGISIKEIVPGSACKQITKIWDEPITGDLNGDGKNDAALLLTQSCGGSGTFYYAAACLNNNGEYTGTNAIFLGDRIVPQNISIENGTIVVNYADRKSGESMTTKPSVSMSKHLIIDGSILK